mgnify:FL=1
MAQGSRGKIELWNDFCGPEIPVANAIAYGTSAGGCNYYLGDYKVTGDLGETDTGVLGLSIVNGAVRVSGNNENGKGVAIGTEAVFSPTLMGPLIAECRVQRAVLTAGNVFFGFCDVNADDVAEPVTVSGATFTLTASDLAGFTLDSQADDVDGWYMPYNGGTTTGETTAASIVSGIAAVAAEWDVLRIEIMADGRADWYINGVLEQTKDGAVSTSVLQACYVGAWGTTTTAASVDVDYLYVSANRDWTR